MNKKILLILLYSFFITGCEQNKKSVVKPAEDNIIQLSPETIKSIDLHCSKATIKKVDFNLTVNGIVKADPNKTFAMNSPVAGKVLNVFVSPNDLVLQNQILAEVISQEIAQLQFDLADNEIELRGQIAQAELEVNLTKNDYEREDKLFKQGISAQKDLLEADNKYARARKALSILKEKRKLTKDLAHKKLAIVGANNSQSNMGITSIRSPKKGTILKRSVNPGELVDSNIILFQVSDLSEVFLEAQIYEKDISNINLGETIYFQTEACSDENANCKVERSFIGQISYISPTVDPETRTITVRAKMPNQDYKLKPEMYGKMKILLENNQALVIPKDSIQQVDGNEVIYLKTQKGFKEQKVTTGRKSDEFIEILSGLKPGTQVVNKGSFWVKSELHGEQ